MNPGSNLQLLAPDVLDGVEDVVGIGDDGNQSLRKLLQHVLVSRLFALLLPRGDRAEIEI